MLKLDIIILDLLRAHSDGCTLAEIRAQIQAIEDAGWKILSRDLKSRYYAIYRACEVMRRVGYVTRRTAPRMPRHTYIYEITDEGRSVLMPMIPF